MSWFVRHAYDIGGAFAALLWPFFRRRRRISIENILRCGVTGDPREAARIAAAAWRHFAGHICEAICVPKVINAGNFREHLQVDGADPESRRLLLDSPEEPILILSSHHGVWEAATNVLSIARPMIAISRPQNNKFVQRWLAKHHFRGPVTLVDKNRGFTVDVLRQWKRENAALTILMDQHTKGGALLKFFGRPAMTFTSGARIAIRSGAPIVVGSFVRVAPYVYRVVVAGSPIRFSRDADRDAATQLLNDRLEAAIRQYPEQYLWCHRRWRND